MSDCGCEIDLGKGQICYCSKHAAVDALIEALKRLVQARNAKLLSDSHRAWEEVDAALTQAGVIHEATKEHE